MVPLTQLQLHMAGQQQLRDFLTLPALCPYFLALKYLQTKHLPPTKPRTSHITWSTSPISYSLTILYSWAVGSDLLSGLLITIRIISLVDWKAVISAHMSFRFHFTHINYCSRAQTFMLCCYSLFFILHRASCRVIKVRANISFSVFCWIHTIIQIWGSHYCNTSTYAPLNRLRYITFKCVSDSQYCTGLVFSIQALPSTSPSYYFRSVRV